MNHSFFVVFLYNGTDAVRYGRRIRVPLMKIG